MCRGRSAPGNNTTFNGKSGNSIAIIMLLWQISSSAGATNTQNIARAHIEGDFPWQPRNHAIAFKLVDARRSRLPTAQAIGPVYAPFGQQSNGGRSQEKYFTAQPIAAAIATRAARSMAQAIATNAHRQFHFKRLDGRVARIAHMHMHTRQAIGPCPRAHTP